MSESIPLDVQAFEVECAAANMRSAVERHEEMARHRKWNPDLIPSEWRHVLGLEAAAETMRRVARQESEGQ